MIRLNTKEHRCQLGVLKCDNSASLPRPVVHGNRPRSTAGKANASPAQQPGGDQSAPVVSEKHHPAADNSLASLLHIRTQLLCRSRTRGSYWKRCHNKHKIRMVSANAAIILGGSGCARDWLAWCAVAGSGRVNKWAARRGAAGTQYHTALHLPALTLT